MMRVIGMLTCRQRVGTTSMDPWTDAEWLKAMDILLGVAEDSKNKMEKFASGVMLASMITMMSSLLLRGYDARQTGAFHTDVATYPKNNNYLQDDRDIPVLKQSRNTMKTAKGDENYEGYVAYHKLVHRCHITLMSIFHDLSISTMGTHMEETVDGEEMPVPGLGFPDLKNLGPEFTDWKVRARNVMACTS